jgi:hypothetical protein
MSLPSHSEATTLCKKSEKSYERIMISRTNKRPDGSEKIWKKIIVSMAKPENQLQLKNGFGELGNIFAPKRYQNW